LLVTRVGRVRARDRYDPNTVADSVLMFADNFAQPAANAVSHNGQTERAWGNKPSAESIFLARSNAQHEQTAALDPASLLNVFELSWTS
jgi:hypothetical protein